MDLFTSTIAQLPPVDGWSAGGILTALTVLLWGLFLLRRIHDRHERTVVGLVGLVATCQGLHLAVEPRGLAWFANALGVICCVAAMAMLDRVVRKHRNAAFALRLSEALEMPSHNSQRPEFATVANPAKVDTPGTILESAPMAMFAVGLDGSVSFWNAAAERLLGWSSAEVLGNRMPNLVALDDTGVAQDGPIRLLRKDGAEIRGPIQSVPVRNSLGAVSGILTIVTPGPV